MPGGENTIAAFVDGLNLYHGMRDVGLLRYRWLDIRRVCERLAVRASAKGGRGPMTLTEVVYCTSYVRENQAQRRQDLFVQALESHCPNLRVLLGRYEEKGRECGCACGCHNYVAFQKEKRTDVNLAVEMMEAATGADPPAAVMLVTGDTDLVPAIEAVRSRNMTVVVAAPPARHQEHLNQAADIYLRISRTDLRHSPLPAVVHRPDTGYPLTPPTGWDTPPWQ